MKLTRTIGLVTALATVAVASAAQASAVGIGNLVVLRVGNGSTAIASAAGAVSLLEFTAAGAAVQSINVPSAGTSSLTLKGSSGTEGSLSISPDLKYVTFGGYRADAGATDPSAGTVDRVIGVLPTSTFAADTSRSINGTSTGNFSADSFRSVITTNGSTFYLSGAGASATGGLKYYDGVNAPVSVSNGTAGNQNTRQVQIINGQLFVASGSAIPGVGVFKVGTGTPTSGPQTYTATAPFITSQQDQNYFFADLNANDFAGTGLDTVYLTDTNFSALRKYSFDGTNWVAAGAITGVGTVSGLAGGVVAATGSVQLYVTTQTATTGVLATLTDANASTSTLAGSLTTLATAGTNYAFRGVVIVPEPATLGAIGGVAITLLRRRRR